MNKLEKILQEKRYYNSLDEAILNRARLWNATRSTISSLSQKLFDDLDIENSIFIINEFFNKDLYSINSIDVLVELSQEQLESVVDLKILEQHRQDNINYYIYVQESNRYYVYKDFLKEEKFDVNIKRNIDEDFSTIN